MGINRQVFQALLAEEAYKPIFGRVLLIGRSTVTIRRDTISRLAKTYGRSAPNFVRSFQLTKHSSELFDIDDIHFIKWIAPNILQLDVMDVSPYEGATVIHDLNKPIPQRLESQYDFIFDSSVLDNIFNPAQGLINIHSMLRPEGRYLGLNVSSFYPGAFTSLPPEWFYAFFAINDYLDVKVYLAVQREPGIDRFEYITDLYRYQPRYTPKSDFDHFKSVVEFPAVCHTITLAEKKKINSGPRVMIQAQIPVNLQYISSANAATWPDSEARFIVSGRPLIGEKVSFQEVNSDLTHFQNTDHYIYLGSGF